MARKGGEQTVWVNGIRVDLVQPHQSDRVRLLRAVAGFTGPMPPTKGGSRPLPRKKHVPGQARSPRIRGDLQSPHHRMFARHRPFVRE